MFPTLESIRTAVSCISERFDIRKVFLFGSCSRDEATENSDIDLCLETGPSFSLFNAGDYAHQLAETLGRPIDIVTEQSLHPYARASMLANRVLIYEHT